MSKDFLIWLFCRPKSAFLLLVALLWGLLGVYLALLNIPLLFKGQRATATVLALVDETGATVPLEEASPTASQSVPDEKRGAGAGEGDDATPCVKVAPRVRYPIGNGETRDYTHTHHSCPTPFEVGKPAYVLFNPPTLTPCSSRPPTIPDGTFS